jgi:DNA-binding transcriptional regulator YiaG
VEKKVSSKMKCPQCSSKMTDQRENVSWKSLPGVVLTGVTVHHCRDCGERIEEYRAMGPLDDAVCLTIAQRPERLNGAEIRLLRSHLELNGAEFARVVGSTPSTVARWENQRQPVGLHAELLIRAMVLLKHGLVVTPLSIQTMARGRGKPGLLRFAYRAGQWRAQSAEKVAA